MQLTTILMWNFLIKSKTDFLDIKLLEIKDPEEVEGFPTEWSKVKEELGWDDHITEYLEKKKNPDWEEYPK
jgi:hypothetical protein